MRRAYNARLFRERLFLYILVAVLVVAVLFPFLWLLMMSFKPVDDIFAWPPKLLFTPTIEHYTGLWAGEFSKSFWNSLVTSVGSTVAAMLLGVPGAFALSRMTSSTGGRLSLLILASRMAPPIAFTIPYFLVYRHLALLDTRTGLALIYLTFNLSLVIWLMRSFFDQIPRSLEEAAWIDGASYWQSFIRIILPMTGPGLAATAILCFLYSWNDFFFALILTRTEATTAPVAIVNFLNYEGWEWGKIAAGGTMVMLPVLVFSIVVRKFLISGMSAGAVKG
ncbi:MAG: carbohydrate ABC transporter permease [Hyphomicrobiales bacterium]|nr:carbohydrate ABC transporter permease [Hyphomicrobiales bacterium]